MSPNRPECSGNCHRTWSLLKRGRAAPAFDFLVTGGVDSGDHHRFLCPRATPRPDGPGTASTGWHAAVAEIPKQFGSPGAALVPPEGPNDAVGRPVPHGLASEARFAEEPPSPHWGAPW